MSKPKETNNNLVLSYLDLRKAVGVIGITLPFVLALGKMLLAGPGIESSMSSYYYTIMRGVFVGSLWAIGVFLFSYKGYALIDNIAAKLATFFAISTSLFPTSPSLNPSVQQLIVSKFHAFFAASLFLTLAYFALFLFRKTDSIKPPTPQKIKRNRVYTICGVGIVICIVLAFAVELMPANQALLSLKPIFWLEALSILFFGISWFVKGEAILKDEISK